MECKEICDSCPWGIQIDPLVERIYEKLALQDAGCPLEKDDLDYDHWHILAAFKVERTKWNMRNDKIRRQAERDGMSNPLEGE